MPWYYRVFCWYIAVIVAWIASGVNDIVVERGSSLYWIMFRRIIANTFPALVPGSTPLADTAVARLHMLVDFQIRLCEDDLVRTTSSASSAPAGLWSPTAFPRVISPWVPCGFVVLLCLFLHGFHRPILWGSVRTKRFVELTLLPHWVLGTILWIWGRVDHLDRCE